MFKTISLAVLGRVNFRRVRGKKVQCGELHSSRQDMKEHWTRSSKSRDQGRQVDFKYISEEEMSIFDNR